MEEVLLQAPLVATGLGSNTRLAPHEVQKVLAQSAVGWRAKRISRELGCSRNTVREYLRQGGWRPMEVAGRSGALEMHQTWLAGRLQHHRGNADVLRQDLAPNKLRFELGFADCQTPVVVARGDIDSSEHMQDELYVDCRRLGDLPQSRRT